MALAARHPEIRFAFDLVFGDYVLRTDAEEIDISNTSLESTAAVEEILPCFHNLKKVVMCQCGISSEEMDALNRKYEDIRFVWSVNIGGLKVMTVMVPDADAAKLRQIGDMLRDKDASVAAVLATVNGEKVTFLAVCGKEAIAKGVKVGDLVKQVCTACGGSGGGKPDSAMGGGKDATKVDNALALVDDFVASKVK